VVAVRCRDHTVDYIIIAVLLVACVVAFAVFLRVMDDRMDRIEACRALHTTLVHTTVVDKTPLSTDRGYVTLSDGRTLYTKGRFWYESMIGHEYNVTIYEDIDGMQEITGWSP
jgi:hypothetical protein